MRQLFYKILVTFFLLLPGSASALAFANPLRNSKDTNAFTVTDLVGTLIQGVLGLTGVLAVAMIIWAAVTIIIGSQQGNDQMIGSGKQGLLYAVIGLFLAFLGYVLVNLIIETLIGSISPA